MTIPAHPLANLFPMLGDDDADALTADIRANGLRDRIVILDRKILDGRNRYRAAVEAGVIVPGLPADGDDLWMSHFKRFLPGDGDPLAWVLSKNLHRRHLSDSQRAMVADRLATMRQGERTDLASDSSEPSANLPKVSNKAAADMLHVSERSVRHASAVRERGAPELIDRVESGEVAVSAAAEIADLPVGDQLAILANRDPKAFRHAVRQYKAGRAVTNSRQQPPDDVDYSPTPPWATRVLTQIVLPHLGQSLDGMTVLEPCCGEGHISGVVEEAGPLALWASDIFDYSVDGVSPPGWVGTRDYLAEGSEPGDGIDWVITNPPFADKAEKVTHRALAEAGVGVAMFLRLGWLASNGRYDRLFSINPPTLLVIFAEDVPLHMGRWEPDGVTQSDYMWLVWIKGEAPRAPFWVPPGQRKKLSLPGDVERFTANPVRSRAVLAAEVHAEAEALVMGKDAVMAIIVAEYTGNNGAEIAAHTGRPINTIRKWAWQAGKSDVARNIARGTANLEKFNREKQG